MESLVADHPINCYRLFASAALRRGAQRLFPLLLVIVSVLGRADTLMIRTERHPRDEAAVLKVAEFYGTTIQTIEVGQAANSNAAVISQARDPKTLAVIISGDALSRLDPQLLMSALRRPGGSSVPVLVLGIQQEGNSTDLKRWSGGAIQGCSKLPPDHKPQTLNVGNQATLVSTLSGLKFPAVAAPGCAMQSEGPPAVEIVLSTSATGEIKDTPVLTYVRSSSGELFFSPELRQFDSSWIKRPNGLARGFASMAPYILFFSHALGEYGWHSTGHYANLTIDDAWLADPYGPFDYRAVLGEMETHNFHTTLAFVPWNFDRSKSEMVSLFREHQNRYSICIHGNNHAHREFGAYSTNSLERQVEDVKQGIARMDRFTKLTGIPYDRFMVFPHGVAPEPTFAALKTYNFLGTANASNVPLGLSLPDDPTFLLRPYTKNYADFLSFSRYSVTGGIPKLEIAVQSFLGTPILFYDHAELFFSGSGAFNAHADAVNTLQPDTDWTSLGEIARHAYLLRKRLDAGYDVRMFSNEMVLENTTGADQVFHVELDKQMLSGGTLTIDGAATHVTSSVVELAIPARGKRTLRLTAPNDFNAATQDIAKRNPYVYGLRMASDFRDIYLMRSSWGNAFISLYYRHNWNSAELFLERTWWLFAIVIGALFFSIRSRRRMKRAHAQHKPLRACMVAYTFYETDNRVRRYAEALAKRGDEVDAIALRRQGQPRVEMIRGVRVYRIQERRIDEKGPFSYLKKLLLFFFRSAWLLTLKTFRQPYDMIHVHSVPDFQVFATIAPRLAGTRVILDIHDIVPEFYGSKFKVSETSLIFRALLLVEKFSAAYSNHIIIANDLWYTKLTQRSVRPEKCTSIINYPDLGIFSRRPRTSRSGNEFVMCYPGTLNWHQGIDIAIRAMALIGDKAPNLSFLIIGEGPSRDEINRLTKEFGIESRVKMTGLVPMEQIAEAMANVDLGVVPKRKDSFGNEAFSTKIMEFMAMGVPVVISNTRVDQYYFNDKLVQFFESGSVEDLAEKILLLIHDQAKRNALCVASTEFIRNNNWDVKKHEYFDLVDRLVGFAPAVQQEIGREAISSLH